MERYSADIQKKIHSTVLCTNLHKPIYPHADRSVCFDSVLLNYTIPVPGMGRPVGSQWNSSTKSGSYRAVNSAHKVNKLDRMTHEQKVRVLYKTILRLHRGMPPALQEMGNNYVKDEFKRHKNCSPTESKKFMSEWAGYALNLAQQLGLRGKPGPIGMIGEDLTESQLEFFRAEQLAQLYELLLESKR